MDGDSIAKTSEEKILKQPLNSYNAAVGNLQYGSGPGK